MRREHIYTPVPIVLTDSVVMDDRHTEGLHVLMMANGGSLTLPPATGSGKVLEWVVGADVVSGDIVIQCANSEDRMVGQILMVIVSAIFSRTGYKTESDTDTIRLNGGSKGGLAGDRITLIDCDPNVWILSGVVTPSSIIGCPLSAEV